MVDICQAQGIAHEVCEIDQLTAFTSEAIITALSTCPHVGCIALVHCETTSGLLNPLDDIVEKVREDFPQCKIFVDAMSSIGAVRLDVANIEAVAFSSNKGIEGPPGLALVVLSRLFVQQSDKAQHTLSLNLRRHWKHLSDTGQCQFTPPTHVVLGLDEALRYMLDEEGAMNRHARYVRNRDILCAGMAKIGFKSIVSSDTQAPVIVTFPLNGMSYQTIASKMYEYGYVIYEGKIPNTFRVGCMGISNTQMEGFVKTFAWANQTSWL
jgi:2-aminoethylphosphonate-pyruvate transaminase